MPQPNGYRKALRFMKHADKFGFPIVTFVDTPGAYAGKNAEELGQGEVRSRCGGHRAALDPSKASMLPATHSRRSVTRTLGSVSFRHMYIQTRDKRALCSWPVTPAQLPWPC